MELEKEGQKEGKGVGEEGKKEGEGGRAWSVGTEAAEDRRGAPGKCGRCSAPCLLRGGSFSQ